MSVLYLLNSLDLMCYNQKDEEKEEEGKLIPFTMCLFLFVLNGVSKSVVTDNLYSFSNHLFHCTSNSNKVNMLMINRVSLMMLPKAFDVSYHDDRDEGVHSEAC